MNTSQADRQVMDCSSPILRRLLDVEMIIRSPPSHLREIGGRSTQDGTQAGRSLLVNHDVRPPARRICSESRCCRSKQDLSRRSSKAKRPRMLTVMPLLHRAGEMVCQWPRRHTSQPRKMQTVGQLGTTTTELSISYWSQAPVVLHTTGHAIVSQLATRPPP